MRMLKKDTWPHQTKFGLDGYDMIVDWCNNCIGKRSRDWITYGTGGYNIAAFKAEEDLLAFKLRWKSYEKIN